MKRFLGAMALACVFSVSALAGDLPTGGLSSPAPTGTTSPGDLPTGGFADQVSDAALSALLSVLGLVAV